MSEDQITVDDLLAEQAHDGFRVTIESIENDPDRVKVTPFLPAAGCQCNHSLKVRKELIGPLTKTGESHYCCGKTLSVVVVAFTDDTLTDLFGQVATAAEAASAHYSTSSPSIYSASTGLPNRDGRFGLPGFRADVALPFDGWVPMYGGGPGSMCDLQRERDERDCLRNPVGTTAWSNCMCQALNVWRACNHKPTMVNCYGEM